jgi:hypothetical protein
MRLRAATAPWRPAAGVLRAQRSRHAARAAPRRRRVRRRRGPGRHRLTPLAPPFYRAFSRAPRPDRPPCPACPCPAAPQAAPRSVSASSRCAARARTFFFFFCFSSSSNSSGTSGSPGIGCGSAGFIGLNSGKMSGRRLGFAFTHSCEPAQVARGAGRAGGSTRQRPAAVRQPAATGLRLRRPAQLLHARASGKSSGDPSVSVSGPARAPAREGNRTRRGARRRSCTDALRLLLLAPRLLSHRAGARAAAAGRAQSARGASDSIARTGRGRASLFASGSGKVAFCAQRGTRTRAGRARDADAAFDMRTASLMRSRVA